jgi:hypothetical protein
VSVRSPDLTEYSCRVGEPDRHNEEKKELFKDIKKVASLMVGEKV